MNSLRTLLFAGCAVFAVSCKRSEPTKIEPAADNTKRNADDSLTKPTADQGAQTGNDLELAAKVRKVIVDDSALSTNAHNVKVVVDHGRVTLAGPVDNPDERQLVLALAHGVATDVVDHLEVVHTTATR